MIVYHFSPKSLVEELKFHKEMIVDKDKIHWKEFSYLYDWMLEYMHFQLKTPNKYVSYPWWAWVIGEIKEDGTVLNKPNIRDIGHLPQGIDGALLTLDVPDNELLLSDFEQWSWFLQFTFNKGYRDLTKYKSWKKRIFDVNVDLAWKKGKLIQATFWIMRWSDVINVEYFSAA